MTPDAESFPPAAVMPDLRSALAGVWSLTWRRAFSPGQWRFTAGLMVFAGLMTWVSTRHGSHDDFADWAVKIHLLAIMPTLAFLSGAALVREDMQPVAVDYLLSRPVRRPVFLALRYLCHLACMQVAYLLVLGAIAGVALARGIPGVAGLVPMLAAAQVLAVTAFLALGFLFGAFTNRYLVLGIAYAGLVEVTLGSVRIQISQVSVLHHVRAMMSEVYFDFSGTVAPESVPAAAGFVLVFAAIAVGLASLLFSMRELAGAGPKEP